VHIGSDHAGYELKNALVALLRTDGHEVVDHGPAQLDPEDDYPTFCIPTAQAVMADPGSLGIVLGGSGNGEQMAANKVKGVRAALAYDLETATLAREHNNANVISLGARKLDETAAAELVRAFLDTEFSAAPRHARRIALLDTYEATGSLPGQD
ncbi:MAG: ribose-5-phosphate isomerase, partial [Propionibacteriales bacterium]|nr:ribose-5-phosphate isomerase [Propionibacteriales bacterium]